MNSTVFEVNLFCLLIICELYFFQKKLGTQSKGYTFVYLLSALGIFCTMAGCYATDSCVKSISVALGVCFDIVSASMWCKYALKIKGCTKSVIIKFALTVCFAVLAILSAKAKLNMHTYLLILAMISSFLLEQYNKIRVDNLTKLYNRYGMDAELKEQLRQYEREHEDSFYVISCDLDNFKNINDTWGHLEGDRALVLIARTLSKVAEKFRSNVFRIGGDEFVIITDKSEKGLADAVIASLKEELDNIKFRDDFDIKMSIGVSLYDGVTPISELLESADKRMYEAKRKSKTAEQI